MFNKLKFLVFSLFAVFSIPSSWAIDSSSAFNHVPRRFKQQDLTLSTRGIGDLCYSRGILPDGTFCNASRLGEVKESILLGRFYLGNGYAALSSADSLLNKPLTKEYLQSLFNKNSTTSVEAHAGIAFTTKNFQATFSPYRVQYSSEIRNPNLQVMAIHASIEKSFTFSYGTQIDSQWSIGSKLKILNRQFIHQSFSLFTAISQDPSQYLPVEKQTAIFLDPSFTFFPADAPWRMSFSGAVENLGGVSKSYDEYPNDPDLNLGIGIEPPIPVGSLKIGVEVRDLFYTPSIFDMLRFGASYQYGVMEVMTGVNSSMLTGGMLFNFSILQAGVVYEFIHDDLVNGGIESRIATEFSVKL